MLPVGEIVALGAVCCIVLLGFIYLTYRCCRSMTKINRDTNQPQKVYAQAPPSTKFYSFQQTTGKAACAVTDSVDQGKGQMLPHRVTVSTIEDLINEKSDLHPCYLTPTGPPSSTPPHTQAEPAARGMTRSPGFHEELSHASRDIPDAADDSQHNRVEAGLGSRIGGDKTVVAMPDTLPQEALFTELINHKDTAPLCDDRAVYEGSVISATYPHSRQMPYTDASTLGPHADTYI